MVDKSTDVFFDICEDVPVIVASTLILRGGRGVLRLASCCKRASQHALCSKEVHNMQGGQAVEVSTTSVVLQKVGLPAEA